MTNDLREQVAIAVECMDTSSVEGARAVADVAVAEMVDHAEAEQEAAVAAAYADAASLCSVLEHFPQLRDIGSTIHEDLANDIRARANTDPIAARDAWVRAEALREAAVNLRTYAPHLEDGPEHDVGYYHGYQTALDRILALIPVDEVEKRHDQD